MIVYEYDSWKKKKHSKKTSIGIAFLVSNIKAVMNMS